MKIVSVAFEESILLTIGSESVQVVAFKTQESGNIKFGINAPRSIKVHREEIYHAIKQKEEQENEDLKE